MTFTFEVNGTSHTVDVDADTPLLWVLRDVLGLTGTKFGCGVALCGACTVHIDGAPARSCVTPIRTVGDRSITTIEPIGQTPVGQALQRAWIDLPRQHVAFPLGTIRRVRDAGERDWTAWDRIRGPCRRPAQSQQVERADLGRRSLCAQIDEEDTDPVDVRMKVLGGLAFRRPCSDVTDDEFEYETAKRTFFKSEEMKP